LIRESNSTDTRLDQLWMRVFQRPITRVEREAAADFLARFGAPSPAAGATANAPTANAPTANAPTANAPTANAPTANAAGGDSAEQAQAVAARELPRWLELCHALLASNEFLFRL
jgi:hypothetical protein